MEIEDATRVENKRQALDQEIYDIEQAAIKAEEAEESENKPSAKERFSELGKRIIALSDESDALKSDGQYCGEQHYSFTEIGAESLVVITKAREGYTPGSLRGRELNHISAAWVSNSCTDDRPLVRQEIGITQVRPHNVSPETLGALRLIEQSVSVAEEARQSTGSNS